MGSRKYPIIFQLLIVLLLCFDLYVLYYSTGVFIFYSIIVLLLLINSLTNSISAYGIENYNDIFCILDLIEYSCFALMIIAVLNSDVRVFWFLSFIIQMQYIPWNWIFTRTTAMSQYTLRRIKQYSMLDGISATISLIVFIMKLCNIPEEYLIVGFISWVIVLGMWAIDNFSMGSKLVLPGKRIFYYDIAQDVWRKVKSISVDNKGCIKDMRLGPIVHSPEVGTEYYMLPGLIDTHTHLDQNPYNLSGERNLSEQEVALRNARDAVEIGISTICDMGGCQFNNYYMVQRIQKTGKILPHIETTGCFFSKRFGHYMQHGGFVIDDIQSAEMYANYISKLGVKYAKVMLGNYEMTMKDLKNMVRSKNVYDTRFKTIIDSYIENPDEYDNEKYTLCLKRLNKISVYTAEELNGIVRVFIDRGITLFAHAYTEYDVNMAIDAGIRRIEHPGDYSDALIDRLIENNVIVTSTYVAAEDGAIISDSEDISVGCTPDVMNKWYNDTKRVIPELYRKGVKVALGTDAGFAGTPFSSLTREIVSLVSDLGLSPKDVLRSATLVAAEKLDVDKRHLIGEVCPKSNADFVLYEQNFLENINVLNHPSQVWIRGVKVYERRYD